MRSTASSSRGVVDAHALQDVLRFQAVAKLCHRGERSVAVMAMATRPSLPPRGMNGLPAAKIARHARSMSSALSKRSR